jgi:single-strand DNA-binding protein
MPEARHLPKGSVVCSFTVASNRFYKMGESFQKEVSFIDVETWNGLAERCASELDKGRGVRVVGRLKQERWVDTEGQNRSKVKIVAEHVEFKPQFSKDGKEDTEGENEAVLVGSVGMDDTGEESGCPI